MTGKWDGTTYRGDETNETVKGTNASETIYGESGSDTLHGGGGNDNLYATGSFSDLTNTVDKLYGEDGNDFLTASPYAKLGSLLDGGKGDSDRANLSVPYTLPGETLKPITFALSQKGSYVMAGKAKTLLIKAVESLSFFSSLLGGSAITGGDKSDSLYLGGAGNTLNGLGGDDHLVTSLAAGARAKIDGGKGKGDSATLLNSSNFGGSDALTLIMSGSLQKGATVMSGKATVATLKGIESISVTGGDGDDTLFGAGRSDTLGGGRGENTLTAGDGNDILSLALDEKLDTVKGEGGDDTLSITGGFSLTKKVVMSGSLANLTIELGTDKAVTATSIEAISIVSGSGDDKLFGGKKNDTFTAGAGANKVDAGDGDDTLTVTIDQKLDDIDGGKGRNTLSLGLAAFDKAIKMTADSDTGFTMMFGGVDAMHVKNMQELTFFSGSSLNDTLVGLSGDDTLIGDDGNDTLSGRKGDDILSGGRGNDALFGGDDNDSLSSGSGVDTLDGGAGVDTANLRGFDGDGPGLTVTLVKDKTVSALSGTTVWATLKGIENLVGTNNDDRLTGDAQANILDGGDGDNFLDGGNGSDTVNYSSFFAINGGVSVTLKGAQNTSVVRSDFFSSNTDTLRNIENVIGTNAADSLTGDGFDNRLTGAGGNDTLKGGGGNDTLIAAGAFSSGDADTMEGGGGNDTFHVQSGKETVREAKGEGDDTVIVFGSGYTLAARQEVETLKAAEETSLFGLPTPVALKGNEFDNTIAGWKGKDMLTGGKGLDTFLFKAALGPVNVDTITDFSHADDGFQLDNEVFKGLTGDKELGKGAFTTFDSTKPKAGLNEDHRILYDKKRGDLFFDRDGSDKKYGAVQFAHLDKLPGAKSFPTVDHTDFFVV